MVEPGEERRLLRGQGAVGREVQEARLHAAGRQGRRGADRDRRLPRHDDRRQPAERAGDPRRSTAPRTSCCSAAATRSSARRRRRRSTSSRASPEEVARAKKYGEEAEDLLTAMHEVIGHGSGKLRRTRAGQPGEVPEGVLLDARGGARRPDGAVEHLGSEAEGARAWSRTRTRSPRRCTTTPRARR